MRVRSDRIYAVKPGSCRTRPDESGHYERRTNSPGYGLEAALGYTFLHWSEVARAGDKIDFGLNRSQFSGGSLAGEARPAFAFNTTEFWAHGLSVGLDYRF